jgi:aspartyl-tRNA(Asn)/glutamyl-tRNA(Gln) amidotransferase subunit A
MVRSAGLRPLWAYSMHEAVAGLRDGAFSADELLDAVLARAREVEPFIHAYLHLDADAARAALRAQSTSTGSAGLLAGLPFGVKATYDVAGMPSQAGSRLRAGRIATDDARLVAQLRAHGALCVGLHNTWEYGTGNGGAYFDLPAPPARNPWDTARFTGGSSTGGGASVAAGSALFALGSDTTGSVRLPAAATGTVGLIPTPGRFSLQGILPNCHSLDIPGSFTRTAADAATVLALLGGQKPDAAEQWPRALADQGLRGMRVAVLRETGPGLPSPDPELAAGFEQALRTIERLGAHCTEVRLPVAASECFSVTRLIGPVESAAIHAQELRERPEQMGFALRDKLLAGSLVRAVDYLAAQRRRAEIGEQIRALLDEHDALVTFGALHLPPRIGVEPEMTAFTVETLMTPFNLAAVPAMVQCTGYAASGLPLHWQIVARQHREADMLRLAIAYERTTTWRERLPQPGPYAPFVPFVPATVSVTPDVTPALRAFAARHGLDHLPESHLQRLQQHVEVVAQFGQAMQPITDKARAPLGGVLAPASPSPTPDLAMGFQP